jgi:Ca-activated chloride channel family protein
MLILTTLFDNLYLGSAYRSYISGDYNASLKSISQIETKSLESEIILANSYYRLGDYKMAKKIYSSIRSGDPKIKRQLLYQLGNCEAKLAYYERAKGYYIQALAFGEDSDTLHNLKVVTFLKQKHKSKLGVTNPTSPEVATSSNKSVQTDSIPKRQKRVGGAGGDGAKSSKNSTTEVSKSTPSKSQRRFSSKAYDLINRGYIQEVKPW